MSPSCRSMAPLRRDAYQGNFWGDEAAALGKAIGARLVIPCHYQMFSFNSVTPDAFVRACHEIGQPYAVLRSPASDGTALNLRRSRASELHGSRD
ncbi:MAG: hypothetical protein R3B96_17145 [Pirellulaceae bacterium]